MTASVYLAVLFGAYMVAVSIPMLWDPKRFIRVMEAFIDSSPTLFLTGVLALLGGVSIICFHNIWTADWRVIVTLFGWAAAIEGALMIAAPAPLIRFGKTILQWSSLIQFLGIAYLALGAFLISRAIF